MFEKGKKHDNDSKLRPLIFYFIFKKQLNKFIVYLLLPAVEFP